MKASLLFGILPTIALGILFGAYPGYKTYEYVWKNEKFCTTCHVHDYANIGWKESAHGQLTTCHDCHHQPLRAYIREGFIYALHQPKFPQDLKHIPHVPKKLCQSCHVSGYDTSTITGPLSQRSVDQVPKVDKLYLHNLHLKQKTKLALPNSHELDVKERKAESANILDHKFGPERSVSCMDCHGGPVNRGHNFKAVDSSCIKCHTQAHGTPIGKNYGCRNCHFQGFTLPIDSLETNP